MDNFRLSANNCQLVHLSGGPPCGAALFKRRGSRPSETPAGRLNVFSGDVLRVRRKSTFYANQDDPSSSSSVSHKSHRGDFEATNPSGAVLRVNASAGSRDHSGQSVSGQLDDTIIAALIIRPSSRPGRSIQSSPKSPRGDFGGKSHRWDFRRFPSNFGVRSSRTAFASTLLRFLSSDAQRAGDDVRAHKAPHRDASKFRP